MACNIANTLFEGGGDNNAAQIGQVVLPAPKNREDARTIVKWLSPLNFASKQADVYKVYQSGTGEWLWKSLEFQDWLNNKSQILWIREDCSNVRSLVNLARSWPSKLISRHNSMLFERLRKLSASEPNEKVTCIYCQYQMKETHTAASLLAAIWRQLITDPDAISSQARALYDKHSFAETRPSLEEVMSVLGVELAKHSIVSILVDAFDECPVPTRNILVQKLQTLLQLPRLQKTRIRLMVTSRQPSNSFPEAVRVEIVATGDDLGLFVKETITSGISPMSDDLSKLVRRDHTLENELVTKIVDKSQGMFLMARLCMESLEHQTSVTDIRVAIKDLSAGLNGLYELYEEAWTRVKRQPPGLRKLGQSVVYWLASAFTQMTVEQLRDGLAIREGDTTLSPESRPVLDLLTVACHGLVKIDAESQIVRPAHYTTKEFFERLRAEEFPNFHQTIASTCLTYLRFDVFGHGPCKFISSRGLDVGGRARGLIDPSDILARRISQHPFVSYAAHYWGDHARDSPEQAVEARILAFLHMTPNVASAIQAKYAGSEYQYDLDLKTEGSLALHAAVCFRLEHIVHVLLGELTKAEINGVDCRCKSALHWAVESKSTVVAQRLLQAGADLESTIRGEAYQVVRILHGVGSSEATETWYRTGKDISQEIVIQGDLVYIAVKLDQIEILTTYIRTTGEDSDARKRASNVVGKAAILGKTVAIELAITHGAHVEARNRHGKTPLMVAIEESHLDAARLLLAKNASPDVGCQIWGCRRLLQRAVASQTIFIQRLTLVRDCCGAPEQERFRKGTTTLAIADTDVFFQNFKDLFPGKPYRPLSWSIPQHERFLEALHEDSLQQSMIEALLEQSSDLSLKTDDCQTILHLAVCSATRLEIILKKARNLPSCGLDVNARDAKERTPLHCAAAVGNAAAMRTLLQYGGDIHARGANEATPLHFAVETFDCINVALENCAGVKTRDSAGRAEIHYLAMLANEPNPQKLTAWQKSQLNPTNPFEAGIKEKREALGVDQPYFSRIPRSMDMRTLRLFHSAYQKIGVDGRFSKDIYNLAMGDYVYLKTAGQVDFADTADWLVIMKKRYKLWPRNVEKAIAHAFRRAKQEPKTWTIDLDEFARSGGEYWVGGNGQAGETLNSTEPVQGRTMTFDGERPASMDSSNWFLIPSDLGLS